MANTPYNINNQAIGNYSKKIGIEEYSRPDPAFRAYYNLPSEKKLVALWRAYLDWRKRRLDDDYRQFDQYVRSCSLKAKNDVEAMPNPLRNGKKGEHYSCAFLMPESVSVYILQGLEAAGLEYAKDSGKPSRCIISGTPTEPGEFSIKLVYAGYGVADRFERQLDLRINPDPKDLWRNIPTDENIEYFKEDVDGQLLALGDMAMLAASRRGRSHAHGGLPRDDDFAISLDQSEKWYIMAVADGAGSAEFSRRGSQIACSCAIDSCVKKIASMPDLDLFFENFSAQSLKNPEKLADARKLVYSILPQAAFEAHKAIREEAREMKREARLYATTLLMVMAKKYAHDWVVLSFQIGDGAMAILRGIDESFEAILLAEPDEGEYGGQTRFITMNDIFEPNELMRRLRVDIVPDFESIILMTDGISDACFATLANLRDNAHWKDLWRELQPAIDSANGVEALLDWLNFWSRGNHDDRTIAVLYPRQREGMRQ